MGRSRKQTRSSHARFQSPVQLKDEADLPDLLEAVADPFLLVLDVVQDPHNLGACIRSAEAAGCDGLIFPKNRSSPVTETVRHVACGAAEELPLIQVTNLARCLDLLKERFIRVLGTGDEESQSIFTTDLTGPLALVMGAEGEGLRRLTAEKCDELVAIPMAGSTPCLNVSVATGVCLFEALRQRTV